MVEAHKGSKKLKVPWERYHIPYLHSLAKWCLSTLILQFTPISHPKVNNPSVCPSNPHLTASYICEKKISLKKVSESGKMCYFVLINCRIAQNSPEWSGFIGEYKSTIDAKGRFSTSSRLLKQLPEQGKSCLCVLNRGSKNASRYTRFKVGIPSTKKISELNDFDPKSEGNQALFFLNGAVQIELDSSRQDHFCPKTCLTMLRSGKDIVLVSAINKIEIWDRINTSSSLIPFSSESFSNLANEVMNKRMTAWWADKLWPTNIK